MHRRAVPLVCFKEQEGVTSYSHRSHNARVDLLNTYSHVPDLGPGQSSEVLQEGAVRLCLLFGELLDHISQNVLHLFQAEASTEGQP